MLPAPRFKNNLATGTFYFAEGLRLMVRPQLRLFVIVPLLVNCALFIVLTGVFIHYYGGVIDFVGDKLPDWLAPLAWIAWIVLGILFLIVYGYSFNLITTIIAAPFYGILAAKTEELLTGNAPQDEALIAMTGRVFLRELSKLIYFFSRGIVVILVIIFVGTIPIVSLLAPLIGLTWSAWSMAIQYADYAADNNQLQFQSLRECLWKRKYSSLGFGGFTMLCSITPIVNIFAMPVAVTGGTLFWLRELKGCQEGYCDSDSIAHKP